MLLKENLTFSREIMNVVDHHLVEATHLIEDIVKNLDIFVYFFYE